MPGGSGARNSSVFKIDPQAQEQTGLMGSDYKTSVNNASDKKTMKSPRFSVANSGSKKPRSSMKSKLKLITKKVEDTTET
mmetsp:Transcript_21519/g.33175  ORF Transcript_21519/g.33175 Transcript_21519/m.33175 type:complete len:80 (-) Transcript_21519:688-927(-)